MIGTNVEVDQRLRGPEALLVPSGYEDLNTAKTRRWKSILKQRLVVFNLIFSDVLLALLAWGMAYLAQTAWGQGPLTNVAIVTVGPAVAAWIGLRALLGLYPGYGLNQVEELRRHTYAALATVSMIAVFATALQFGEQLSRLQLFLSFLGILFMAPLVRNFLKWRMKKTGLWGKPVMVLGSGQNKGKVRGQIVNLLREEWDLGYNPVATFNCGLHRNDWGREQCKSNSQKVGFDKEALMNAVALAKGQGIETAIFAMPYTRREQLAELVRLVDSSFRHVLIIPNLSGITNSAVTARNLDGTFAVEIKHNLLDPWALRIKRLLDLLLTAVSGVFILPLIAVLGLMVYLESGGPVFYKDRRMGRDNRLFACVKFRTMIPNAEAVLQRLLEEDPVAREEYTEYHKLRNDPRVTRMGSFLRKTSLDELPQLWNVLKGEMSLVGPRPYLPRESLDIGSSQSDILRVPPGITGPWQVSGRNYTSFGERVRMDGFYIRDWSVWLDIVLLARTVKSVLSGGAY